MASSPWPIFVLLITGISFALVTIAEAQELTVAVASNFTAPMEEISSAFAKATNISIRPVYASTGKLFAMIENGGPFDLFLAADSSRPAKLYNKKMSNKPFVYAKGTAVLWTNMKGLCAAKTWQEAIAISGNSRVVIANPELAPYGTVTMEVINKFSSLELQNRFVYGQNVAQSFAFANKVTGFGFTDASLVRTNQGKQGCYWPVDEAQKVEQAACMMSNSKNRGSAEKFASYLVSETTKKLLLNYGYID